jgi:asparagine synthase (glutamine-hydrolysing)
MCGIAGIVSIEKPTAVGLIGKMTSQLQHRGPDAKGCVRLSGCDLGHCRLSIIDLSTGDQPMSDSSGRWWIVFNGEIYNYQDLKKELALKGAQFRTRSDTEVILQGYIVLGEEVVSYLNGQFSFAIWDRQEHTLFAARDRFGEKPFYWAYSFCGNFFLFASEIKSILATNLVKPKLDNRAVDLYLGLYYVPPDQTIYSNVFTLEPGHLLRWHSGQARTHLYWRPKFSKDLRITPEAALEQIQKLLRAAVRRQMISDVPVGAFLSGGLDSSTIVALMSELTDQPVMTFSVGFRDLINELPYAREVAAYYQTLHHEIHMDIPVGELLERMSIVYDEPFADSSNIPTYLLAEFAGRLVKVCLSGDGGDEIFGGYSWYHLLLRPVESKPQTTEALIKKLVLTSLKFTFSLFLPKKNIDSWEDRLLIGTLFPIDRRNLWQGKYTPADSIDYLRSCYKPNDSVTGMDRVTGFDVNCYLPGDILVKVDRAAMAHGLESRSPFLDVELAEFVLGLPWQLRFKDADKLKYLLRATNQHLWPENIRSRSKQGFGAPIDHWVQRSDVKKQAERILRPASPLRELLTGLNKDIYEAAPAAQKWTLLCLGLWLENHTDSF